MRTFETRLLPSCILLTIFAVGMLGVLPIAHAAPVPYSTFLLGVTESPPNASPAVGDAEVDIDAVAHLMHVHVDFSGLLAPNTASHIHATTAAPGVGTAGVATTTPTFTGFPGGTTSGTYDHIFDTSLTSSFNASFVTANGGTAAGAEAALFAAIAAGKAYVNVHSSVFPGGEIRGFLAPGTATPTSKSTWGRIKTLYR